MIGDIVTVVVDRPLGSRHPEHPDLVYPVNYGFIPGILAGDGEEQDAYILGVEQPGISGGFDIQVDQSGVSVPGGQKLCSLLRRQRDIVQWFH